MARHYRDTVRPYRTAMGVPNRLRSGFRPSAQDWKALRERHEIPQTRLAALLAPAGITLRAITGYEQGQRTAPAAVWRYALAQLEEIRLPELVKDPGDPP